LSYFSNYKNCPKSENPPNLVTLVKLPLTMSSVWQAVFLRGASDRLWRRTKRDSATFPILLLKKFSSEIVKLTTKGWAYKTEASFYNISLSLRVKLSPRRFRKYVMKLHRKL
jgi:hypothetical protein